MTKKSGVVYAGWSKGDALKRCLGKRQLAVTVQHYIGSKEKEQEKTGDPVHTFFSHYPG